MGLKTSHVGKGLVLLNTVALSLPFPMQLYLQYTQIWSPIYLARGLFQSLETLDPFLRLFLQNLSKTLHQTGPFCLQETQNFLTNADRSTNTYVYFFRGGGGLGANSVTLGKFTIGKIYTMLAALHTWCGVCHHSDLQELGWCLTLLTLLTLLGHRGLYEYVCCMQFTR